MEHLPVSELTHSIERVILTGRLFNGTKGSYGKGDEDVAFSIRPISSKFKGIECSLLLFDAVKFPFKFVRFGNRSQIFFIDPPPPPTPPLLFVTLLEQMTHR